MKASRGRDKGDQFVSVASIARDALPKVEALEKSISDEWDLMLKHFAMVHSDGTLIPGGLAVASALGYIVGAKRSLRSAREVDPQ